MSVFEIPKFEISSEDAESFDFPSYIADKYEDHEYCGGFLIKPPADFIKPYNFETLSQAMPVVEWSSSGVRNCGDWSVSAEEYLT